MTTYLGDNPCDREAQQLRQELLEDLYFRDGRDSKSHALHGTYTGLWIYYTTTTATPSS